MTISDLQAIHRKLFSTNLVLCYIFDEKNYQFEEKKIMREIEEPQGSVKVKTSHNIVNK